MDSALTLAERMTQELADFQSQLFRTLIVKEKVSTKLVAEAFAEAAADCLFEAIFIKGKVGGRFPSGVLPAQAYGNMAYHAPVAEEAIQRVVRGLERAFPKYVWTAWVSSRLKPL